MTALLPVLEVLFDPAAEMMILPFFCRAVGAFNWPEIVTRLSTTLRPAAAVTWIVPPAALIVPLFSPTCFLTAPETPTSISPSPYMSIVNVSPEPRSTFPSFALIVPLFMTLGATSPTRPASLAVIVPSLTMEAFGLPGIPKFMLPAMKSEFLIFAVVATRPLTSTCEPGPKNTPFGLIRITLPFAVSVPSICDGFASLMRFRVTEEEEGWLKWVASLGAMLKDRQSITARCVDWLTSSTGPLVMMFADPLVTVPPAGLAPAIGTNDNSARNENASEEPQSQAVNRAVPRDAPAIRSTCVPETSL